jgi:23S rRNA pseudouridine1911/1915/1917 synthase
MTGDRLDVALSEMLPDYSRSKITAWIKSGAALINN